MNKIVIALDYNPSATRVAETGYALAKDTRSELAIVHVITDPSWYAMDYSPIMGYQGGYTSGTMEVIDEIKKEAENFLAATVKHLGGDNITTAVLDGGVADAILKFSAEWEAGLIVLGSHSHHGLDRIFGTDTAAYILKHSKVPVLAIPTTDKF